MTLNRISWQIRIYEVDPQDKAGYLWLCLCCRICNVDVVELIYCDIILVDHDMFMTAILIFYLVYIFCIF